MQHDVAQCCSLLFSRSGMKLVHSVFKQIGTRSLKECTRKNPPRASPEQQLYDDTMYSGKMNKAKQSAKSSANVACWTCIIRDQSHILNKHANFNFTHAVHVVAFSFPLTPFPLKLNQNIMLHIMLIEAVNSTHTKLLHVYWCIHCEP